MPRKSDIGGDVTSSSVGANVQLLFRGEELERVHFAQVQAKWCFVGRIRDEAEKNGPNSTGMMTVDLANLKSDGNFIFPEDTFTQFRDILVRRFVPLLNERFNNPRDELTRLPEDVGDALRLLVLCERLKAMLKEDVKAHLDKLVAKAASSSQPVRPNEGAPFRIVHASLELDTSIPPRGSLQERVVHRAIESLASSLPEALDACEELVRFASELGRHEMAARLFRAATEKALGQAGIKVGGTSKTPSARAIDELVKNDSFSNEATPRELAEKHETIQQIKQERAKLQAQLEAIQKEKHELKLERAAAAGGNHGSENDSPNNGGSIGQPGLVALGQGLVLEKVGNKSGERVVRVVGDQLEWKQAGGRFSKENSITRSDITALKIVGDTTLLVSTRTGLLTLRANTDACIKLIEAALAMWQKDAALKLKKAPSVPSPVSQHQQQDDTSFVAKRFPRLSASFKRGSFRFSNKGDTNNDSLVVHQPQQRIDYSFASNDS